MSMTAKQLHEQIKILNYYRRVEKELEKTFGMITENHTYGLLGRVETNHLALLKIAMNDEHDWISYFVYDCDMGKAPKEITFKDGKKLKLATTQQLYKLIHTEI
jgi:hypothetical protein